MPESGVRFVIGRIPRGYQFDGSLSHEDESEAETYGLYQRVRVLHSRRPTVAHRLGRRSQIHRPVGLDLAVRMHHGRSEAHVASDTKQIGMGARHSTHYCADLSTTVQ